MRLKFMPVMDMLATMENQRSSQRGTCLEAEYPEALDTIPTSAVTAKWNPVNVVAAPNFYHHHYQKIAHSNLEILE